MCLERASTAHTRSSLAALHTEMAAIVDAVVAVHPKYPPVPSAPSACTRATCWAWLSWAWSRLTARHPRAAGPCTCSCVLLCGSAWVQVTRSAVLAGEAKRSAAGALAGGLAPKSGRDGWFLGLLFAARGEVGTSGGRKGISSQVWQRHSSNAGTDTKSVGYGAIRQ